MNAMPGTGAIAILAVFGTTVTAVTSVRDSPADRLAPVETVFEHVRVLPMDSARALEDQTVIVRAGRIVEVGPSALMSVPENARLIDGRGATLVPGLADLHVHLYSEADLLNYVAHGVTTVMDLNGAPRSRAWRERSRLSSNPVPTVYLSGPSLSGYPSGNPSFVALDDPALAAFEVRRQKAVGYDLLKTYSMLAPSVYRAVTETAREEGLAVVGHIPLQLGLESALASGQVMIAHAEEFWKVVGRADSAHVDAAIEATRASGAWVTPNLSAIDRILLETAHLPALMNDPEAEFMSPAAYSEWIPSNNRYWGSDTANALPTLRAEQGFIRRLTPRLSAAGVPLLVGTDSPVVGFAGASVHHELALLVDAGLSPYDALTAATRTAGEFVAATVDAGERFGRIAPGYRADLLLVEGDPLTDVAALTRIRGVMTRGAWRTAEELHDLRETRARVHSALRDRVRAIDSLIVDGQAIPALHLYDATRAEYPGEDLIAEVVLWSWGLGLLRGDRGERETALRVFGAMVRAYPFSHAGWRSLAEAQLAIGDTAAALADLAYARELSPSHAAIADRLARLEAAGLAPEFEVAGVYRMLTEADVGGERREVELILTLERSGETWTGRIDTDTPLPPLETSAVTAGGNRLWVSAPLDGRSLDLRLIVEKGEVRGAWNLGSSEQGLLRGRRS